MPWVHSDAQDAFALFLQFSRDIMDDHIEEGNVEEEEDEGSDSSFFARGGKFLRAKWSVSFVIVQFCVCWIGDQHDSIRTSKWTYTSPIL